MDNSRLRKGVENVSDIDLARGLSDPVQINFDDEGTGKPGHVAHSIGEETSRQDGNCCDDLLVRGLAEPVIINLD